jgi:pseudouridine synthase
MVYIMLNKPERTLVSAADEPGLDRRTVLDLVDHPSSGRLFPVGRLDYDTTGLVILTNDGKLTNRLTHPRYQVVKTYQAVVRGQVSPEHLEAISKKLGAEHIREAKADPSVRAKRDRFGEGKVGITVLKQDASRTLLEITLTEAKNRQIREVLAMLGCPVKKLSRVALGPLILKALPVGQWRELSREEISLLREAGSRRAGARKQPSESPKNRTMKKGTRKAGTPPRSSQPKPEAPVTRTSPPERPTISRPTPRPRVLSPRVIQP